MKDLRDIRAPYIRKNISTTQVMGDVALALIPALLGSIYYFGLRSLLLTGVSVITCVAAEYLWQLSTGKQVTAGDFSAVVTGMLIAFQVPVTTPVWAVLIASLFAILIVKQLFGGIGSNFLNPALAGRLLIMVLWPAAIVQYVLPRGAVDAVSSATVLTNLKGGSGPGYSYLDMFLGRIPGSLGETSKLLLLIGFGYLCYKGLVNAAASVTYIITVVLVTFVLGRNGWFTGDILSNLLGGGLILGACFMLTDYSFISARGRLLYSVIAGVITALVRLYSVYPEGVCFGILAANCLVGLMTRFEQHHVYGVSRRGRKEKEGVQ